MANEYTAPVFWAWGRHYAAAAHLVQRFTWKFNIFGEMLELMCFGCWSWAWIFDLLCAEWCVVLTLEGWFHSHLLKGWRFSLLTLKVKKRRKSLIHRLSNVDAWLLLCIGWFWNETQQFLHWYLLILWHHKEISEQLWDNILAPRGQILLTLLIPWLFLW